MKISLNFEACFIFKIRDLGAKLCGFYVILILKGIIMF